MPHLTSTMNKIPIKTRKCKFNELANDDQPREKEPKLECKIPTVIDDNNKSKKGSAINNLEVCIYGLNKWKTW
jgi:hypothetical protein